MITLIGHGYIGKAIQKELELQKIKGGFQWITHNDSIPRNTTTIINSTGFTGVPNVDQCEISKQETINGNVIYPVNLEVQNKYTPIIHISSGCIYTGYKDGGWTEEDEPNFDFNNGSFYSGSKALGQELLKPYLNKSYLLRIRMPFGDTRDQKNLFTKLEKYNKLIDYENSLSYIVDVAKVAVHFTKGTTRPGIYNVCNPGSQTTKMLADRLGLNKEWFTKEEFKNHVVAPRSNCVLNTKKLEAVFPIQSIESALDVCIPKYNEI